MSGGKDPLDRWLIAIFVAVGLIPVLVIWGMGPPDPPPHQPEMHQCVIKRKYTQEEHYWSKVGRHHYQRTRQQQHVVVYDLTSKDGRDLSSSIMQAIGDTVSLEFCEFCYCWEHFDSKKGSCKE